MLMELFVLPCVDNFIFSRLDTTLSPRLQNITNSTKILKIKNYKCEANITVINLQLHFSNTMFQHKVLYTISDLSKYQLYCIIFLH